MHWRAAGRSSRKATRLKPEAPRGEAPAQGGHNPASQPGQPSGNHFTRLAEISSSGIRLHRHVEERPFGRRRDSWRTSKELIAPWRNTDRCAPSSSMSRWSWTPSRTRKWTPSSIADPAFGQRGSGSRPSLPGWRAVPPARWDEGRLGLEEERRLAYVGLTRQKNLHLWFNSTAAHPRAAVDHTLLPWTGCGSPCRGAGRLRLWRQPMAILFASRSGRFLRRPPRTLRRLFDDRLVLRYFRRPGRSGRLLQKLRHARQGAARDRTSTSRNWGTRSRHQVEYRLRRGRFGYGAGRSSIPKGPFHRRG